MFLFLLCLQAKSLKWRDGSCSDFFWKKKRLLQQKINKKKGNVCQNTNKTVIYVHISYLATFISVYRPAVYWHLIWIPSYSYEGNAEQFLIVLFSFGQVSFFKAAELKAAHKLVTLGELENNSCCLSPLCWQALRFIQLGPKQSLYPLWTFQACWGLLYMSESKQREVRTAGKL